MRLLMIMFMFCTIASASIPSGVLLLSPSGGQTYQVGDTVSIRCVFDTATIRTIYPDNWYAFAISVDSGRTYNNLVSIFLPMGSMTQLEFVPNCNDIPNTFIEKDTTNSLFTLEFKLNIGQTVDGQSFPYISEKVFFKIGNAGGFLPLQSHNDQPIRIVQNATSNIKKAIENSNGIRFNSMLGNFRYVYDICGRRIETADNSRSHQVQILLYSTRPVLNGFR